MMSTQKIMKITYHNYTYRQALAASEKINWCVEDIIGGEKKLDFTKPFMPETLARTEAIDFLSPRERLALNHIRGNGYLAMFGLLEEIILPFVLDHTRSQLENDAYCIRSFLEFAGEEAKHLHLFERFREEFQQGFGIDCEMIGPVDQIARILLSHQPLAVALFILQAEWMTQSHYTDSVSGNDQLDPQFKSLLKHHWMEEAQHAKLDTLMIDALAADLTEREIDRAVDEYFEITNFMDAGLKKQVECDLESLSKVTGRTFSADERNTLKKVQHQAQRWTFLVSGMSHPNFLATFENLVPAGMSRVEHAAVAFL